MLIEGGARILGEAFDHRLVHQVCFYVAPMLLCGPHPVVGGEGVPATVRAPRIMNPAYERIGYDLRLMGEVVYPEGCDQSG